MRKLLLRSQAYRAFGWGLFAAAVIYLLMASALKLPLFAHSAHDSYALQAMTWRSGHIALPENYEWLELAIYQGRYYISFPPFPAVPMWLLSFFFGLETPSMFVNFMLFLGSYALGYCTARRLGRPDGESAAFALFWVAGCNLLEVSLYGGVWNMAQGMGFFLMMLTLCGWARMRKSRAWAYIAPVALACAVGCRPFYAVYVPVALWLLWQRENAAGAAMSVTLRCMLPKLLAPVGIACAYAAYNWVRFGNLLEFGHNYLPEFTEAVNGQFSLAYVGKNIANILRLPWLEDHQLRFFTAYGFAFYLCNPLFLLGLTRSIEGAIRHDMQALDWLLVALTCAHFVLYLFHKSFGAWQFGTRYLIDVLPVVGWLVLRRQRPIRFGEGLLLLWGVAFNIYGGILFHLG